MPLDDQTFTLLKDSVQRFIRDRLVPAENHVEEHDEVPADIVDDMKDLGLFGISIPEEYGGIGLSMAQECEVAYALGRPRWRSVPSWALTSGSARKAS